MTSPNQYVRDELDRFRQQKGRAFYALQINAPWGAGKTHFVNAYLNEVTPETPCAEGVPRSLRITLFGAQSVADIEKQIFVQLLSKSSHSVASVIATAFTGIAGFLKADKAAQVILDEARAASLAAHLQEVRQGLIVFDDLERSSMPLKDALGYINYFIEREGFRVVLISNEDAWRRDGASDKESDAELFREFKEKLVGRTLRLKVDPDAAYADFVKSMACDKAREVASNEQPAALHLFRSSGRENLRSLRIGLEAFDRVVPVLDPRALSKVEALREILLSCLYVAVELPASANIEAIAEPETLRARKIVASAGGSIASQASTSKADGSDIVERYRDVLNLRTAVIPFRYLIELLGNCSPHLRRFDSRGWRCA